MYSQILRRDWQLPSIRSVVSAGYTRLKHLSRGKPNHGRIARLPCRSCVDIAWNLSCPHAGSLQCIWATTMFVPESPIPLRLVVSIFVTARSPFSSSSILALQLNLSRWSQSLGREPWLVKPAWKQTSCCPADSAPRIPPCAVPPLPGPGAAGWRAALPAAPWAAWRWWRPWLGPPFAAQRPWRRRGWRWCMARSWYLELWADIWDDNYLGCFFLGGWSQHVLIIYIFEMIPTVVLKLKPHEHDSWWAWGAISWPSTKRRQTSPVCIFQRLNADAGTLQEIPWNLFSPKAPYQGQVVANDVHPQTLTEPTGDANWETTHVTFDHGEVRCHTLRDNPLACSAVGWVRTFPFLDTSWPQGLTPESSESLI